MRRPKFNIDQPVVALKSDWLSAEEAQMLEYPATPRKGLVYIVASQEFIEGAWMLRFVEITADLAFDEQYFAPFEMLTDATLLEMLQEIAEGVPA